jgi:hypothetical protein
MKCISIVLVALTSMVPAVDAWANPLPEVMITEFSTDPAWIELGGWGSRYIGGAVIYTASDSIVVNEGVVIPWDEILILDETNTSGVCLDPVGDLVVAGDSGMSQWFGYGSLGEDTAPPIRMSSGLAYIAPWYENYGFSIPREPSRGQRGEYLLIDRGNTEVVIGEVNFNSTWPNGDFVELYNLGDTKLDISNWSIVGNHDYTIPEGTIIRAHDHFALRESDYPEFFSDLGQPDNIYLLNGDNVLVDQVGWSAGHSENVSFMRYPDGDAHIFNGFDDNSSRDLEEGFPTCREFNRHDSPGLLVIGCEAKEVSAEVQILWTSPVWEGDYETSALVRKTDGFSANPDDGVTLYEGTEESFLDSEVLPGETYFYTVFAYDDVGNYSPPQDCSRDSITLSPGSVPGTEASGFPDRFALRQNSPNPFNSRTVIGFELPFPGHVRLEVYNLLGEKVATLIDGRKNPGYGSVVWDASALSSGIYLCSLTAGDLHRTGKMLLLR